MLRGILKLHDPGRLIVETAGIGYEVFVPIEHLLSNAVGRCRSRIGNPSARAGGRTAALWIRHLSGKARVRSADEKPREAL